MVNDPALDTKTPIPAGKVTQLFRTCVSQTYFVFNKKLYTQVNGLAIGAATSGFAAELFMEKLENKAIHDFIEPPNVWRRYVDHEIINIDKILPSQDKHIANQSLQRQINTGQSSIDVLT